MTLSDDHSTVESMDAEIASDRAAVISMVALFEGMLGDAIRNCLVPLSKIQDGALFGDRGPLATLSAKIDFGDALGIYGKETKTTLHPIQRLRNNFAHQHARKLSITRLCSALQQPAARPDERLVHRHQGLKLLTP